MEVSPADTGDDHRRLLDNVVALTALRAANFILPLLTLPYLARVLGPGKFGLVAFSQSTLQYMLIVTDFGFNLSATRAISVSRNDSIVVGRVFSAAMTIRAGLALGCAAALAILIVALPPFHREWRLFALSYGMVVGNVLFPVWLFQGMERMRFVAALSVLSRFVFTVLVFVFIRTETDYQLVPALNSAGSIVAGVLSLVLARRVFSVQLTWPSRPDLIAGFRDSWQYFASRISVSLYTSINVFLLGATSTQFVTGLYASAERIYQAMLSVYQPLTNALFPYMARTRNVHLFRRVFLIATAVNLIGCAVLFFGADLIVGIAFGPRYAAAAGVLRLLALAMCFVLPTFFLGFPFLAAFGYPQHANGSAVAGSVFHVVGLSVLYATGALVPRNVAGLVASTEFLVFSYRAYAVLKTGIWRRT